MVAPSAVARAVPPAAAGSGEAPPRDVASAPRAPRSADAALYALLALATLSPWAFGGVTPPATRLMGLAALGASFGVALVQAGQGALWRPRLPLWPVAALLGVGLAQLLPLPAALHSLVAPGSAAVWHPADAAAASWTAPGARPVSIHPAATRAWLGLAGGLLALVLLSAPALGRHSRAVRAAWILVGAGTLVAVYGIVSRALFGPLLYGHIAVPTVAPFGPFVNKNHFAGYVLMPALLALGLGRGLARRSAEGSGRSATSPVALLAFSAAAAMVLAVLLSMSRGGALGLACGIAAFALLDAATGRRQRARRHVWVPVALAALVGLALVLLPGDVHDRLFNLRWREDQAAVFRLAVWGDALKAWMASPLLGHGLGAFADALPPFKTTAGLFAVEHPENEPLELAVEGGLLALLAAIAAWALLFARAVRAIKGHHDRVLRGIVTGALAGTAALAVHGLVDFNLRIPSNAALFAALAGIAAGATGSATWTGRARWAPPLALAALGALFAATTDPWPLLREARLSAARAHAAEGAVPAAMRLSLAERDLRTYLARRPADPEGWLLASWVAAAAGRPDEAAALARHARALDPRRPDVGRAAESLGAGRRP